MSNAQTLFSRTLRASIVALIFLSASGEVFSEEPHEDVPLPATENASEMGQADGLSALTPLMPAADFGTDVIDALAADPLGPVNDPNVDGMPALDEPEMGVVDAPKEADDRMWRLRPYLKTGVTYDDNIFITNTNRTPDIIYNVEGGFAFELGDYRNLENSYLLLKYLATGYFFTDHSAQNSLNQSVDFMSQYRIHQAALQLESLFQSLDGADRQVGAFTSRLLFFNALRLLYDYSDKTQLAFEANQSTNYYPEQLSSYIWEARASADYKILPKTTIGLQLIGGLNFTQDSPEQVYQTLNARASYDLTGKLVIKSSVGLQFNQYLGGGEAMRILPVFSLGADYQFSEKTKFTLKAYRNLLDSPSLAGQDYIATGGEFGVQQNLFKNIVFGLAVGYENDTYVSNTDSVTSSRVDNFYFFRPSLSYNFLKNLDGQLSYEYRANASNFQQDSWFDNRVSLELSLKL